MTPTSKSQAFMLLRSLFCKKKKNIYIYILRPLLFYGYFSIFLAVLTLNTDRSPVENHVPFPAYLCSQ